MPTRELIHVTQGEAPPPQPDGKPAKGSARIRWALMHQDFVPEVEQNLPRSTNYDIAGFMSETVNEFTLAVLKNPRLAMCTTGSCRRSILQLARWGLSLQNADAYLVPFGNSYGGKKITECTLMVGWKGLVKTALRSGQVETITSSIVFEGDHFEHGQDQDGWRWQYQPVIRDAERGPVVGAFAAALLKNGQRTIEYMTVEDMEKIREQSKQRNKGKESPAWSGHTLEMYRKTVTRRLCKRLPLQPEEEERMVEMFRAENVIDLAPEAVEVEDLMPRRISAAPAAPLEDEPAVDPDIVDDDGVKAAKTAKNPTHKVDGHTLSDAEVATVKALQKKQGHKGKLQAFLDEWDVPFEHILEAARNAE